MPKVPSKTAGHPKRLAIETDRARQSREQHTIMAGKRTRRATSRNSDNQEHVEPLTGSLPQGVSVDMVTGSLPHHALPEGVASTSSAAVTDCLPRGGAAGAPTRRH